MLTNICSFDKFQQWHIDNMEDKKDSCLKCYNKKRLTTSLELKTMFSSCISKRLNTSVIGITASIKGHSCDPFLDA
ncbi:hypothetical protein HanPSC8_Chr16g0719121 [Helianthus annuus]|nr:hypothetical protein HanPSC8_Chr16g0719121 [Helianthus annuus]